MSLYITCKNKLVYAKYKFYPEVMVCILNFLFESAEEIRENTVQTQTL